MSKLPFRKDYKRKVLELNFASNSLATRRFSFLLAAHEKLSFCLSLARRDAKDNSRRSANILVLAASPSTPPLLSTMYKPNV